MGPFLIASGRLFRALLGAFLAVVGLLWETWCAKIITKMTKPMCSKKLAVAFLALLEHFWKTSWLSFGAILEPFWLSKLGNK